MAQASSIWAEKTRRAANWLRIRPVLLRRGVAQLRDLPGPRSIGSLAVGQDLMRGNLKFGGRLIIAPEASIWAIVAPDDAFRVDRHGFLWLDHLAAVPEDGAEALAQDWSRQWLRRHGRGRALAWLPEITARRLIRWLHHYDLVVAGFDPSERQGFDRALWRQALALRGALRRLPGGLPGLEILTALALCARVITGFPLAGRDLEAPLARVLEEVGPEGQIANRAPEDLLRWLTHLVWIREDLQAAGVSPPEPLTAALARITPVLRSLRHANGALARFHGGGAGVAGQLDAALAGAGVRGVAAEGGLGFTRLTSGRSSLIVDTAAPPFGPGAFNGHASTLAFELVSGRRPLIVSCGSGAPFGPDWHQAGRATPSHSVLGLAGISSSRLGPPKVVLGQLKSLLATHPDKVTSHVERHLDYLRLEASHDGYAASHGVLVGRALEMTIDGSAVTGEEVLLADTAEQRARFDAALLQTGPEGLGYVLRFHLHPDVKVVLDVAQASVTLTLKSGEVWVFRHDGGARLTVEPSVYLEAEAARPTATKQVVLTGHTSAYTTRIRWSLAKTHESLKGIRDLAGLEAELTD